VSHGPPFGGRTDQENARLDQEEVERELAKTAAAASVAGRSDGRGEAPADVRTPDASRSLWGRLLARLGRR